MVHSKHDWGLFCPIFCPDHGRISVFLRCKRVVVGICCPKYKALGADFWYFCARLGGQIYDILGADSWCFCVVLYYTVLEQYNTIQTARNLPPKHQKSAPQVQYKGGLIFWTKNSLKGTFWHLKPHQSYHDQVKNGTKQASIMFLVNHQYLEILNITCEINVHEHHCCLCSDTVLDRRECWIPANIAKMHIAQIY